MCKKKREIYEFNIYYIILFLDVSSNVFKRKKASRMKKSPPSLNPLMHSFLMFLQAITLFGFICATSNITTVPNYANIVDIHLVSLQGTTLFGFIFATLNVAMVPSYANIVDMHLV